MQASVGGGSGPVASAAAAAAAAAVPPDGHTGSGEGGETDSVLQWEQQAHYYYRPRWYRPLLLFCSAVRLSLLPYAWCCVSPSQTPLACPAPRPQVCTAFGAGYQAIAVAGWLQYFFLLRFLEWERRRLRHWIAAWLVHALGFLLAMAVSEERGTQRGASPSNATAYRLTD